MKLYKKLKLENPSQIPMIDFLAGAALHQMGLACDYAIKTSDISEEGFLILHFVECQVLNESEVTQEMQKIFDEVFSELINDCFKF